MKKLSSLIKEKRESIAKYTSEKREHLEIRIEDSNTIQNIIKGLFWSAPKYIDAIKFVRLKKYLIRILHVVVVIGYCIYITVPDITLHNPEVGLVISIVVTTLVWLGLVFNKTRLATLRNLGDRDRCARLISGKSWSPRLNPGVRIEDWKFYELEKCRVARLLRDNFALAQPFYMVRIVLRALLLLVCYSAVIMFANTVFGGSILYDTGKALHELTLIDYMHKGFTLFLSVSSRSVITMSTEGVVILFGQIIVYASVLIVVIDRISNCIATQTNDCEAIANHHIALRAAND